MNQERHIIILELTYNYTEICRQYESGGLVSFFNTPPRYRSYVLTLWEERSPDPDTQVVWRFSLKDPHTGERRGFASLEEMTAFLRLELASGQANWSGL